MKPIHYYPFVNLKFRTLNNITINKESGGLITTHLLSPSLSIGANSNLLAEKVLTKGY